jgi:hypothetical protein
MQSHRASGLKQNKRWPVWARILMSAGLVVLAGFLAYLLLYVLHTLYMLWIWWMVNDINKNMR